VRIEIHVARGGERRPLTEVDEGIFLSAQVDGHEPAAAQVAAAGMHDRQRIPHGDGRVNRVPALLEDLHPDVRGQVLRGNHHPVGGFNRWKRRGAPLADPRARTHGDQNGADRQT